VVVGEEARGGGARVDGEGELVAKGGDGVARDRPQAAIDAADIKSANKPLAACTITRVLSVVGTLKIHSRYSLPESLKAHTQAHQALFRIDLLDCQTVNDRRRLLDEAGPLSFPILVLIFST